MSGGGDGKTVVQDTASALSHIRDTSVKGRSIASAVLDIQRHAVTRTNWIKSLECLYLAPDRDDEPSGKRRRLVNGDSVSSSYSPELLRRIYLDPVSDPERGREYIAVSYTWGLSDEEHEEDSCQSLGRYFVESRTTGAAAQPSQVRDIVWQRALNYANLVKCDTIWIDRECVDQENVREKEIAIQNMHLVYSLSRHPVALLTHVVETADEIDLLAGLLTGDIREEEKPALLDVLDVITSDLWWQRAWTFQEDYRASTRMTLLIPHVSDVELHKLSYLDYSGRPLFGRLPDEICIKSTEFRRCATEFCLLYREEQAEAEAVCNRILTTAGKYNVLLREKDAPNSYPMISRSMTPTILADLDRREISMPSDRLAIAANCCSYTTRLDTPALNKHGYSLSLSMLALCLLNGEMMENHPARRRGTLDDNVFTYLAKQSLDSFRPPMKELTFIKSCRFVDPVLTPAGTRTHGHLWRLGKIIRPEPLKRNKYSTLLPLETLATDLQYRKYGNSYTELATALQTFVMNCQGANRHQRHHRGRNPLVRSKPPEWSDWMADELECAVMEGKALRLASLVDPERRYEYSPYSAVFVGDDPEDWTEEEEEQIRRKSAQQQQQRQLQPQLQSPPRKETYAFTSVQFPRQQSWLGDIPRHVSLEVEVEWPDTPDDGEGHLPKLYNKRWLNGLCFGAGCNTPTQPVLFPWPLDLLSED
ncbi:hypothetical protein GGS20DRAFT_480907 [Poronia punctata]|nr:hypothetical protein GGS20DRAFT_480907 [Poronia punctata]